MSNANGQANGNTGKTKGDALDGFLDTHAGRELKSRVDAAKKRGAPPGEASGEPGETVALVNPEDQPKRRGRPPGKRALEQAERAELRRPVAADEQAEEVVNIPPINIKLAEVTVRGVSPLIVHKFSDKSITQIRDKQTGKAQHKMDPKDLDVEYQGCFYRDRDGDYAFPASAFKKAMISACRYTEMKMTLAKGGFHVVGDLLKLKASAPWRREDVCRVGTFGNKKADLRYRPQFDTWSVTLQIRYNASAISLEQLVNLLNLAGIGEWRPEKDGPFGQFEVATSDEAAKTVAKPRGRRAKA